MEKTYKYIKIVEVSRKKKTSIYCVYNIKSGDLIGRIEWYIPWRQYCVIPLADTIYSAGCLKDISDFISIAKEELKGR